jgi:hypothetical protein
LLFCLWNWRKPSSFSAVRSFSKKTLRAFVNPGSTE